MSRNLCPGRTKELIEADDIEGIKKSLTIRQLRFCEEFNVDYDAKAAAIRAGYSPKWADRQAHQLIKHEGCRYYINHLTQSKEAKLVSVNPDYVVQKVVAGIDKSDKMHNMGGYFRGLELLARHLGMLRDKTEISGPDGKSIEIEQRTREEVADVINHLRAMKNKNKRLKVVGGTDLEEEDPMNG